MCRTNLKIFPMKVLFWSPPAHCTPSDQPTVLPRLLELGQPFLKWPPMFQSDAAHFFWSGRHHSNMRHYPKAGCQWARLFSFYLSPPQSCLQRIWLLQKQQTHLENSRHHHVTAITSGQSVGSGSWGCDPGWGKPQLCSCSGYSIIFTTTESRVHLHSQATLGQICQYSLSRITL